VMRDVIRSQCFANDLLANSVRVNVCCVELSYAEVDRCLIEVANPIRNEELKKYIASRRIQWPVFGRSANKKGKK
jgi:hypothetical protein